MLEKYFLNLEKFPSIHMLPYASREDKANLQVFIAKYHKNRCLSKIYEFPSWVEFLQVGSALTVIIF